MEEAQEAMGSPGRYPTQLAGPGQLSKKCKLSWHLNDKFRLKEGEGVPGRGISQCTGVGSREVEGMAHPGREGSLFSLDVRGRKGSQSGV